MTDYNISVDMLVEQLERIRSTHGEEAYARARYNIAMGMILKPNGEEFLSKAFPDLDLNAVRQEALAQVNTDVPEDADQAFIHMVRQQLPSIKTQAHFNLFAAAFDALRTCLDGYFTGNLETAEAARKALNLALDTATSVHDIAQQLHDLADDMEELSPQAREYVDPPKQIHEYDEQRRLLIEVAGIKTTEALTQWYNLNKAGMDKIVGKALRNELFDAIRSRKRELTQAEAN